MPRPTKQLRDGNERSLAWALASASKRMWPDHCPDCGQPMEFDLTGQDARRVCPGCGTSLRDGGSEFVIERTSKRRAA